MRTLFSVVMTRAGVLARVGIVTHVEDDSKSPVERGERVRNGIKPWLD